LASSDDRFREMFFEEARELLIGLEEGLMDLERRQGDRAHLDRTFRAAHSLKGAAAMVGLESIARFTNGIEAVLEKIRSGSLAVDSDIITTLLESRDHLAAMIEGEAAGSPVPGSGDLTQRLIELLRVSPGQGAGGAEATGSPEPPRPPSSEPAQPPSRADATQPEKPMEPPASTAKPRSRRSQGNGQAGKQPKPRAARGKKAMSQEQAAAATGSAKPGSQGDEPADATHPLYQIKLTPGPDTLRRGVNPLGVLDELRELGKSTLAIDIESVPVLDVLDPERSYLSWTILVETSADPERLRDVFLFVAEDSLVQVQRRTSAGSLEDVSMAPQARPAEVTSRPAAPQAVHPTPSSRPATAEPSMAPSVSIPAPPSRDDGMKTPAAVGPPGGPRPAADGAGMLPLAPSRPHARIRVDALQLDDLVGLAGELVVLSDNLQGLREDPRLTPWLHALESLQRVSRQIRDTTLELRMVPVDELFSRFPRVVRDLADRSGKEIELRIVGQETRLDRAIIERLGDPMVHLIRNAVDHALETPQERLDRKKPRMGRITLVAGHEGDRVAIRVEDDGRGLDREKIVRKGIARGLIPTGTSPDDPRVVSLIFEPGFSTRENVSELSGRGVGLDVVRDSVRALRGSLTVESAPGKGTAFIFRLPLTLALIDGLLVETAGGKFVVPLAQVEECVSLNGTTPALAKDRPCVSVRGDLVPMISLRTLFRTNGPLPARQELLLTRHAGQRVGVAVDRLVGRVQAVIQSLGEGLHGLTRFSGATILGDGSVSLILDLSALVSESLVADHGVRATPSGGVRAESFR
jgi:two-component system chemotaxis sensor kinase CheA